MKSSILFFTALVCTTAALAAPVKPISALDAFTKCDISAMPKKLPIQLPGGLIIKSLKSDPSFPGQTRVVLRLNKAAQDPTVMVKEKTGYDFTNHDSTTKDAVYFEINESDADNTIACIKKS